MAQQSDRAILLGGTFSTVAGVDQPYLARVSRNGGFDSTFAPVLNNSLTSLAIQENSDVVIAGYFTTVAGVSRSGIARIRPDGSLDEAFIPVVNGLISGTTMQPDGKILIAGDFTNVNSSSRFRIARLNPDGSLDTAFNPNVGNNSVKSLALQPDGKILIAGDFTFVGGVARNFIARLNANGTLDTSFNPGASGIVSTVAIQGDGKIVLGGTFTVVAGGTRNRLARVNTDGSLDTSFNPNIAGAVNMISLQTDGKIIAAGSITFVGGVRRYSAARINGDGTLDPSFISAPTADPVNAMLLKDDGEMWFSGIAAFQGNPQPTASQSLTVSENSSITWARAGSLPEIGRASFEVWNGTAWDYVGLAARVSGGWQLSGLNLPDGSWVRATGVSAGGSHGGSSMTTTQIARYGTGAFPAASISLAEGGQLASGDDLNFGVLDWLTQGGTRSITITNTGTAPLNDLIFAISGMNAADYTLDTSPPASLASGASGIVVLRLAPKGAGFRYGILTITSNDSASSPFVIRLNGKGSMLDTTFSPEVSGDVRAVAIQADGRILIGGYFNTVGGASRRGLARLRLDGTVDPGFVTEAAWTQTILVQPDGGILVGGSFSAVGNTTIRMCARLFSDGSVDTRFNPLISGNSVSSMVRQPDGKILIGGRFTHVSGFPRSNICRLNEDGSLDPSFNASSTGQFGGLIESLALQPDGKLLVGGYFTAVNGTSRAYLARLNADGSLDNNFNPSLESNITAIALQSDGKILLGGYATVNGTARSGALRLNADGTFDSSFSPNALGGVFSFAIQCDGKIVIGGSFTTFTTGEKRNRIARLNSDGSLDHTFNPNASGFVYSLALQADGGLIAGGSFTTMSDVTRNNIVRLTTITPGTQTLEPAGGQIEWMRGGSAPELTNVTMEALQGGIWSVMGAATRVPGGWRVPSLGIPGGIPLRARGYSSGGNGNASSGIVEQIYTPTSTQLPDIAVSEGSSPELKAGLANIDFGAADLFTDTAARTFTLTNSGTGPLENIALSLTDANPGDFLVTPPAASALAPGAVTTFTIRFNPKGSGQRRATLWIASNDADESPFGIVLNGTGRDRDPSYHTLVTYIRAMAVQPDGRTLFAGSYNSGFAGLFRLNTDGSLDPSFRIFQASINSICIQSDGRILIGAEPMFLPGVTGTKGLARLNADGSFDSSFLPDVNSTVNSLSIQSDGKIIVGGSFTTVGGVARNGLARINVTGSLDATFLPNLNSGVSSLALQSDGKIVLAGGFTTVGGITRNRLARVDSSGAVDPSFNPDASGTIRSLSLQADGKILVVIGNPITIGGVPITAIARLQSNGTVDASFNPAIAKSGYEGFLYTIAIQADGKILIGGDFTSVGGIPRLNIARLHPDGSLETSFAPNPNGAVLSLAIQQDGKVLVGGNFTAIGGFTSGPLARLNNSQLPVRSLSVAGGGEIRWMLDGGVPEVGRVSFESWNGSSWVSRGSGTRIAGGWSLSAAGLPASSSIRARGITTGGYYNSSCGIIEQIAAYGTDPFPDIEVKDMASNILVSGSSAVDFGSVNWLASPAGRTFTIRNNGAASLSGLSYAISGIHPADFSGSALGTTTLPPGASLTVTVNFSPNGAAGRYATLAVTSNDADETPFLIALQGTGLNPEAALNPDLNGQVNALALQADGRILVGGEFTSAGGLVRNRFCRLLASGALDTAFNADFGNTVTAIASQPDGRILVGGYFTTANGTTRNSLARLNSDGTLDTSFNPNVVGGITSLALQADGKILIGGFFTSAGAVTRNRLARINADGSLDTTFNPNANNSVYTLAIQADGKIVFGGTFTTIAGTARNNIARVAVDGSLDSTFNPGTNDLVSCCSIQADGRILVGGGFTSIASNMRNRLARLNPDGSLDSTFNPNPNNFVSSIARQADGKILIGGYFTIVGGSSLARLDANGAVDATYFDANLNNGVNAIVQQADGKILIGGTFTSLGGLPVNRLARLGNNTAATQTLANTGTTQIDWLRGGGAPEVERVTFESWNGTAWTSQGVGSRITGGWRKTGASLPSSSWIRARGFVSGGTYNGSGSVIERIVSYGGGTFADIEVREPGGSLLANGGAYGYGTVQVGSSTLRTFTLRNAGNASLTLGAITVTGAHSPDFVVNTSGMATTLATNAQTTFNVTFSPSAADIRGATLQINSNDADSTPFTIALSGVRSPLFITSQPLPATVYEGDSANLSVTAAGVGPLDYQWYKGAAGNTSNPIGENSAALSFTNLLASASYWVRVTSPTATVDSSVVAITVNPRSPVFTNSLNPSGPAGDLFSFQLQASLGPLVFASTNLPSWLSLNSSTGWLTGTPPEPGNWDVNVQASNSLRSSSALLQLVITPPKPVLTSAATAGGRVNDPFSYQITATQGPTTYSASGLPAGLTCNSATGLVSGTPLVQGTFSVTLLAQNGGGTGQKTVSLVIAPPIPVPVITSPLFAGATGNAPFTFQLSASSSPLSFAIQSGPVWLTLNASTGVLFGTPLTPGYVTVQVRAANTTGPGDWVVLTIYVAPHPDAPGITSLAEVKGRKNDPFSFQLTTSPSASTYQIAGALPTGVTLTAGSGLLAGTPSVEGTFNVTVSATNAAGASAPAPLKIIIDPPRLVPVVSSVSSFSTTVGSVFSTTVTATNTPISFTFENLPAGLVQTGNTGQITGTLATPGNFSFSAKATNADGTGPSQTMVLRVQYHPNAPNVLAYSGGSNGLLSASSVAAMPNPLDFPGQGPVGPAPGSPGGIPLIPFSPPVIIAPTAVNPPGPSGYVGVPFSFQVLVDKQATLFTATGLPTGLIIAPATGMIGGTPTGSGSFEVTLQALNASGLGAPRVMTFSIAPMPNTPEITGSLQEETYALLAYSYKIQTSSILPVTSYSVTGLPDGLSANYSTGQISGAATVTGLFEVKLRASSAVGVGAEKILYLLVRAGPLVPKITSSASISGQQGLSLAYQISATNPPILGYQASGLPDGLSLNATTGLMSGKPIVPGIYQVVLKASNVNGAADPLALQIQVKPNLAVPIMLIPRDYFYYSGQPFELELQATSLPIAKPWPAGIGIYAENLPVGMSLNTSTGVLSGFPTQASKYSERYIAFYSVNEAGRGPSSTMSLRTMSLTSSRPVLLSPKQLSATVGQTLSFSVLADRPASSYEFGYFTAGEYGTKYFNQPSSIFGVSPPLPGRYSYYIAAFTNYWGVLSGLPLSVGPAVGAPVIQSPSVIYCTAGVLVSASIAASGSPTKFEVSAMSPSWPSGLVFNGTTGVFLGRVSQSGVISFLARAYNAAGASLTKEITIVFSPPPGAPAITTGGVAALRGALSTHAMEAMAVAPPPLSGKVGEAFSHQFQASGNVIRFGVTGLPAGLVYNENTGEVSGEPTKPGLFNLVVTPIGATVSGQPVMISLQIDPADGTPEITNASSAPAVAGTAFTWQFTANGNPSGYNLAKLPDWLVFNPFTGSLSGTPERPGETMLKISAFNALGQGTEQEFTIESAAAVGTPVMNPPVGNLTGQVGAAFSASISGAGTVSFYDATALPFGISLDSQTGIFSGTPVEPGTHMVQVWGVNAQGTGESIAVTFAISPAAGTPLFVGETVLRLIEGQPLEHAFATVPTATAFAAEGLPTGWTFNSTTGLLQGTPLSGTYNLALEAWNAVGSSGRKAFQIRVFANPSDLWNDEKFGEQAGDSEISGWNADPDHDGVVNLLERAFNLAPLQPGAFILPSGTGTIGLPLVRRTGEPPAFSIQYLRRKASSNSGLIYTPQFSSSLDGNGGWTTAAGTETVESIDTEWERVTVVDTNPLTQTTRFGRVKVSGGAP